MTSERVCGSHPSERSPRTAWHQAGVGVAVHIRTGDDDCAKAKLEPRTSAINERLENLMLRTIPHAKPSVRVTRWTIVPSRMARQPRHESALYCLSVQELAMKRAVAGVVVVPAFASVGLVAQRSAPAAPRATAASGAPYFPERFDWQHKRPDEVAMNPVVVNEAVQAAIAGDTP